MKTFNIRCVTLDDFCDTHELDMIAVGDMLLESDLVEYETLCDMCDIRPLSTYNGIDLMVLLGS